MNALNKPAPLKLDGDNVRDNWKYFLSDFKTYLAAADLSNASDDRKKAIFINFLGDDGRHLFRSFNLPDTSKLDDITAEFEKYCNPKINTVYNRYLFYSRNQQSSEDFTNFLVEIKLLLKNCDFKENDEMLRDRIVLGIADNNVREALLRIPDLKLEKAIEYCRTAEASRKQAQKLTVDESQSPSTSSIDALKRSKNYQSSNAKYDCKKCGKVHKARNCPAFESNANHAEVGITFKLVVIKIINIKINR